jgi:hypothetical protein
MFEATSLAPLEHAIPIASYSLVARITNPASVRRSWNYRSAFYRPLSPSFRTPKCCHHDTGEGSDRTM